MGREDAGYDCGGTQGMRREVHMHAEGGGSKETRAIGRRHSGVGGRRRRALMHSVS